MPDILNYVTFWSSYTLGPDFAVLTWIILLNCSSNKKFTAQSHENVKVNQCGLYKVVLCKCSCSERFSLCCPTNRPDPVSACVGFWVGTARYRKQIRFQVSDQPDGETLSLYFSCGSRTTADLYKPRSQDQCKWQAAAEQRMTMGIVLPELLNFSF